MKKCSHKKVAFIYENIDSCVFYVYKQENISQSTDNFQKCLVGRRLGQDFTDLEYPKCNCERCRRRAIGPGVALQTRRLRVPGLSEASFSHNLHRLHKYW